MDRLASVLTTLTLGLACAVPFARADNLIRNPGFEETSPDASAPKDWQFSTLKSGAAKIVSPGRTGDRCLLLQAMNDAAEENYAAAFSEVKVQGAATMVLKFYAKCDGTARGFASYYALDANGKDAGSEHFTPNLTTGWAPCTWRFTTPANTARLRITLQNRHTKAGSVWFDDVSLETAQDMLENERLRVFVEPVGGGRIRSMVLKSTGEEVTSWKGPGVPGGLCGQLCPAADWGMYDAKMDMQVLEPSRRIQCSSRPTPQELAGVRFEKEFSLTPGSNTLDVVVRMRNEGNQPRKISFRVHNSLKPGRGVFTWPCTDQLRARDRSGDLIGGEVWIKNPGEGWMAAVHTPARLGVVALFDKDKVEKIYSYLGDQLDTLEWWYREVDVPAGGTWEAAYSLAVFPAELPTIAASRDVAVGLSPLALGGDAGYKLSASALRGPVEVALSVKAGTASGKGLSEERKLSLAGEPPTVVDLPWKGEKVQGLDLTVSGPGARAAASLSEKDRPIRADKTLARGFRPPDQDRYADTVNYFPFGAYLNIYASCREAPDDKAAAARALRDYRRNYMNTVVSGNIMQTRIIGDLETAGTSWLGELLRKMNMRAIPYTGGLMRSWKRLPSGEKVEDFPEEIPREEVMNRLAKNPYMKLDLVKEFARKYGDVVLLYIIEDEPQAQHLPFYPTVRDVWREIDPAKPAVPILNLGRAEYLQYVPVHFGDLYPFRTWGSNNHNPWQMAEAVRAIATKATTPVWVMPQAFGTEPRFKNFRNPYHLAPTADARLMLYGAVANGAKGLVYHGMDSLPAWRYKSAYYQSYLDFIGAYNETWTALRETGRFLSAVGLCLVQTDLDLTSKVNVESEPFKARENFYDGPVISANALRQRNGQGFFIVVINQDTETARRGTLSVPPDAAKGKMLCDLYALKPVAAPDMKASIELQPGDGRIFYCGPKAEAEKVVSDVHRNHYRNERAIYRIDEELASKNNADVSAAKAIADRAAKEETAGRFAEAHASILQAQAALAQTIKGSAALRGSLDSLQAARESLSQLTWRYSRNLGVVAPDEVWNAAQSSRVYPENKQDPQMQKLLDSTSEAFSRWSALDARVYAGEAAAVTEDAARLAADAQALLKTADELIAARKAAVQER